MDIESKLAELLDLSSKMGLEVRAERLGGSGGGMCKLKGKSIVFVDLDAEPEARYEHLLAAFVNLSELDEMYLLPEIRSDLERIKR